MRTITHDTFKIILKEIDSDNEEDFSSFVDVMNDRFDVLFDSDIDEILDFLVEEMSIESDSDISNMSVGEVKQLISFIEQIVEVLHD